MTKPINLTVTKDTTLDVGTRFAAIEYNDVVGKGLTHPSLTLTGFIHADEIDHINQLTVGKMFGKDGRLTVHNLNDVNSLITYQNVGNADVGPFSSIVEVTGSYGNTSFGLEGINGPATVILDHVHGKTMSNAIGFGFGGGILELGDLKFDHATWKTNFPTVPSADYQRLHGGTLTLTEGGKTVFVMTNVQSQYGFGSLSTGHDAVTNHDFIRA